METMINLRDLLKHEVKDLCSAEDQLIKALPQMAENATDPELKKSLQQHLRITEKQRKRLDEILQMMGDEEEPSEEKKGLLQKWFGGSDECKGMKGLIQEGEKMMGAEASSEVRDAAIIASAQKAEHYEISSYGTARAFALQLGLNGIAKILEQIRDEEYEADTILNQLALGKINFEAGEATDPDDKGTRSRPAQRKTNGRANGTATSNGKASNGRATATKAKTARSSSAKNRSTRAKASASRASTSTKKKTVKKGKTKSGKSR